MGGLFLLDLFPFIFWVLQESSKDELSITRNKHLGFGSLTLDFLPNLREILHHFPSNLFLPFLNKITPKFYEEIECWKCLETVPPIQSAIEELQGKLNNSIQGYTIIRRARTIPISFCTSKECFHRRPLKGMNFHPRSGSIGNRFDFY